MLLVPQTVAGSWRVLCASVACYFPLVLIIIIVFTLFLRSSVYSSVCHIPCGEARQFLLLRVLVFVSFLSISFPSLFLLCVFVLLFPFVFSPS